MTEDVTKYNLSDAVLALEKQHSLLNGFQDRFDARYGKEAASIFDSTQSILTQIIAELKAIKDIDDFSIYLDNGGGVVMSAEERLLTKLEKHDVDHIRFLKGE